MFVIGLLLFGLCLLGAGRWLTAGSMLAHPARLPSIVAIGLAMTFCTLLGWRLRLPALAGRSPHRDSWLSRPAWTGLGVGFGSFAVVLGILLPWNLDTLAGLGSGVPFAVCCFGAASRPRRR